MAGSFLHLANFGREGVAAGRGPDDLLVQFGPARRHPRFVPHEKELLVAVRGLHVLRPPDLPVDACGQLVAPSPQEVASRDVVGVGWRS